MRGRVLVVAGSDSGGGAGIQADIKTIMALGGYAMTAITALTAQNTTGVHGIHPVPPDFVARQMVLCLEDLGADVIKTGMLNTSVVALAVADVIERLAPDVPLVVDPVMVAKGGAALLSDTATRVVIERLLPRAALLTPNVPEAEVLLGEAISDEDGMVDAASRLLSLGPAAILLKGGHLDGGTVTDILATREGVLRFSGPRLPITNTHGTGCTLASAIACGLAQRMDLPAAVVRSRWYVARAIATA
ncbi:MAG: bifunctional hydroxymethylpyrimidine kinase/phosphomethylpyrimidine kinase, partial [Alphaproteobacteria bacterium]|nr:bifunctional hydroxymethylpyrimidine kinase/phosphomethylpyrimidine kinase [Alphaproteobacteria bacterium]